MRRNTSSSTLFAEVAFALLAFVTPAAAENTWRSAPLWGGEVANLAVAPSDARRLYATTREGLYRSDDSGTSWRIAHRLVSPEITVALDDPSTLWASVDSPRGPLARSRDGGATWRILPCRIEGDALDSLRLMRDPKAPRRLWAATSRGLVRSDDQGDHWQLVSLFGKTVHGVGIDPRDPQRMFALGTFGEIEDSILRSTDGGATWAEVATLTRGYPLAFAFSSTNDGPIYIAVWGGGILRSDDFGATWQHFFPPAIVNDLTISPSGTLLAATSFGVLRSNDQGETWSPDPVIPDLDQIASPDGQVARILAFRATDGRPVVLASSPRGIWRSETDGVGWRDASRGVVVSELQAVALAAGSAGSPNRLALSSDLRASSDGGRSFRRVLRRKLDGVVFDPRDPAHAYAHGDDGLFESRDAGRTWTLIERLFRGYLPFLRSLLSTLAIDPNDPSTLYLSVDHNSRFADSATRFLTSRDGGATWKRRSQSYLDHALALAVDPHRSATLYAATRRALRKSLDGGRTWRDLDGPQAALSLALEERRENTLWVGTRGGEVFRSTDGGATFSRLGTPFGHHVQTLVADPDHPEEILAGVDREGIFRWDAASGQWQRMGDGFPSQAFRGVFALDARNRTLWAATQGAGLLTLDLDGD